MNLNRKIRKNGGLKLKIKIIINIQYVTLLLYATPFVSKLQITNMKHLGRQLMLCE